MDMMERLTVGELNQFINVFYGKNGQAWVRGGGPGPEYEDCSLYDFIREIAPKHGVKVEQENEELDWQMCDMLADGPETKEGLIAFFYSAVVQAVEMRERLRMIEEVLCGDENKFDIDRLRELMEADKAGRCVVLPCKGWLELVFGDQEVFFAIDDDYEEEKVREITVRNEERFTWYDGWKTVVFRGTDENGLDYEFSPDEIGKTVFTTREEAEAALDKMKEAARE